MTRRAVLAEIRRILRPGGRFSFAEHVVAKPRTLTSMIAAAGFISVGIIPYRIHSPFVPFNTHIAGTAIA